MTTVQSEMLDEQKLAWLVWPFAIRRGTVEGVSVLTHELGLRPNYGSFS